MGETISNEVLAEKIDALTKAFHEFRNHGGPKCQVHDEQLRNGCKRFEKIDRRLSNHERIFIVVILLGIVAALCKLAFWPREENRGGQNVITPASIGICQKSGPANPVRLRTGL